MPKVDAGTGERGERESATLVVNIKEIAGEIIAATEDRAAGLKVVFTSKTGSEVSYSVPLNDEAVDRVKPFTNGKPTEFTESALREFIAANAKPNDLTVKVWGTWIQGFMPPVGFHIGIMSDARYNIGGQKVWFTLETREGFSIDFPSAPLKGLETRMGNTPEMDYIGPQKAFNPGGGPFYYFVKLGLDWPKFLNELENCEALWPGHGVDSYFGDIVDIFPEVLDATRRHGLKPVRFEVHEHPQYGISVRRGDFFFELTEVVIEGGAMDPRAVEFAKEAEIFLDTWNLLTQVLLKREDVRFMVGGKLTQEGQTIALNVLKPVVMKYPQVVKELKANGEPNIVLHPLTWERGAWTLDGLVCINLLGQRLTGLTEEEQFQVVNLTDPTPLLAWVAKNVKELSGAMDPETEGVEL